MVKLTTAAGGVGALLAGWTIWGLYQKRGVETVPAESVSEIDGVELRRYPRTVLVETTADSQREAFGRLFRYISGENEAGTSIPVTDADAPDEVEEAPTGIEDDSEAAESRSGEQIAMTAPVESIRQRLGGGEPEGTAGEERDAAGAEVEMTAPVETDDTEDGVRMAFYLPAEYDYDTAPVPTDPDVRLVERPARTLAVLRFSGLARDGTVDAKTDSLLGTLAAADVDVVDEPFLLRYDDPRTPPWLRRNEVAVEVRRTKRGSVAA
jgi:hypothetical protein